jgi:hypothetical protein
VRRDGGDATNWGMHLGVARLIYSAIASLDGCVEDPQGRFDRANQTRKCSIS